MTTKEAIDKLSHELRTDDDYRATWLANLSMCTYDSIGDSITDFDLKKQISNESAERFLGLLLAVTK